MNKAVVASSMNRYVFGILVLQVTHLPRVKSQLKIGINSLVLMIVLQDGQRDLGPKYLPKQDSPIGKR